MTLYEPGIDSDLLVLNWYMTMAEAGDLELAFSATLAPVGAFMESMRKCVLMYEADEKGIWFAAWIDAQMSAGLYGFWIRTDRRAGDDRYRAGIESLHIGLERFPVLIYITLHEQVAHIADRYGFQRMGTIPHLFDGEPAMVGWVDAEHFYPAIAKYAALFDGPGAPGTISRANGVDHG